MFAALPGLKAEEALNDKGHRAFDPDGVYQLHLLAYGDTAAAEQAAAERQQQVIDDMDARKTPD